MARKGLKQGLLISFEGPEGSGKSTQVSMLCAYLRRRFEVLQLREPGGTKIGEKIRRILLAPANKNMEPLCEMLLYQAARAQLVREKILSALSKGGIVVLDRFLDATICYQGYGAGLNVGLIKQIGRSVSLGIQPDLTILLDIGAREGLRRSKRRDRMEKKSLHFHRRVRKGYLELARQNRCRMKVVPVTGSIPQTQFTIRRMVDKIIAGRNKRVLALSCKL